MHAGRLALASAHSAANWASHFFAQTKVGSVGSQTGEVAPASTVVEVPQGGVSFHDSWVPPVNGTAKSNALSPGSNALGRACAVSAAKRFWRPYGMFTVSALSLL